ncbi:MAG: 2-C-methyl-D-erythritol 4-phosphate cytidylyltransferase [Vicinamibacteria bacterium]
MTQATALILAAGRGERLGGDLPKPLLLLRGKPILAYALEAFERCPSIDRVVLVVPPGDEERFRESVVLAIGAKKVDRIVAGGDHRQRSLAAGLAHVGEAWVAVHDGVRPFVDPLCISRCVEAAAWSGAAILAVPVRETIKLVSPDRRVISSPDRSRLWTAQTPQCFRTSLLVEALHQATEESFLGTDEASLLERLGAPVEIVPGSVENIKITTPTDLILAEAIAASLETG